MRQQFPDFRRDDRHRPRSDRARGRRWSDAVSGSCANFDGSEPKIDVWVSGGAIVDVFPSNSGTNPQGAGIEGACSFPAISNTNYPGIGSGSSGAITALTVTPLDGQPGVATYISDSNMMGELMYSNDGETGNPNAAAFAAPGPNTYFEPGEVVVPWGQYYGAAVSG